MRIAIVFSVCLTFISCAEDSTERGAPEGYSDTLSDPALLPLEFDTMVLNVQTSVLRDSFPADRKDMHVMQVERNGHEWYANEWWYFGADGTLRYFKGKWGSESLMGEYFYQWGDSTITLGYEYTDNWEVSRDELRFNSYMHPYVGYHFSSDSGVVNLTRHDLQKKEKEIRSFLNASLQSMKQQGISKAHKENGRYYFRKGDLVSIGEGFAPDSEYIFIPQKLYALIFK